MVAQRGGSSSYGGVSPYIVLGLVLLVISGVALYLAQGQFKREREQGTGAVTHLSVAALKIQPYIESCIRQTTFDAVLALAFSAEKGNPFAREDAERFIPRYVQEHLRECVDWDSFPEFTIVSQEYAATMTTTPLSFIITVTWPLQIQQDQVSLGLNEFSAEFSLPLNKVFTKIEEIQTSGQSIDLERIFDQELDIHLNGCQGGRLIYAIDDTEYQLEGSVITFFFDAPLQNLTELFELKTDLLYKVPVDPGTQILRRENRNKKFIFGTTPRRTVKDCYGQGPVPDAHTFTLIKDNRAIASATTPRAERVSIRTENESFIFEAEKNTTLTLTFFTGEDSFDLVKVTLTGEETIIAEQNGDYLIARNQALGRYQLKQTACKGIGEGDYHITLVALNYEQREFNEHAGLIIDQLQTIEPFNKKNVRYQFTFMNNTCNEFDCEQEVRASAAQCAKNNILVGLVRNPKLGVEHITVEDISYVSSYLAGNKSYCISCAILYEIGKQLGLEDNALATSFMSLKNASLERNINDLSFTKEEKEKILRKIETR